MQDASEIMDVLVKAQANQGEMEPDDPQVKKFPYLQFLWAGIKFYVLYLKFFSGVVLYQCVGENV